MITNQKMNYNQRYILVDLKLKIIANIMGAGYRLLKNGKKQPIHSSLIQIYLRLVKLISTQAVTQQ